MRIGEESGAGAFVDFSRRLNQTSRETLETNERRVREAVERGRELRSLRDLSETTNSRLDRNSTEIEATIQRSRIGPDLTQQAQQLGEAISGIRSSYRALGGTVDIRA